MHLARIAFAGLAVLAGAAPAYAGGVGLIAGGGIHQTRAYYYNASGRQGIDMQQQPNFAYGIEGLLGDKDDRIQGMMRLYVNTDSPPDEPDTGGLANAVFPPAHEQPATNVGVMTLGIQWGLYGDPAGFQVVLNTLAGSGFATVDNLEYGIVEVGGGVTYALNDSLQLQGSLAAAGRYRKALSLTENAYVGLRYMFD